MPGAGTRVADMSAYLFHADAIAELLRHQPSAPYVEWLRGLPREEQFTCAVSMAELYRGAGESGAPESNVRAIEERVQPAVTVLPFDAAVARLFAELRAAGVGADLSDSELQVAATALRHGLAVVTTRTGRFRKVPGLPVRPLPRPRRKR